MPVFIFEGSCGGVSLTEHHSAVMQVLLPEGAASGSGGRAAAGHADMAEARIAAGRHRDRAFARGADAAPVRRALPRICRPRPPTQ